jgi:transcriptional regulator with XRE-family HTH domain
MHRLSNLLITQRKALGLSQEELAEKIGYAQRTISAIERLHGSYGKRWSDDLIGKVAEAYSVSSERIKELAETLPNKVRQTELLPPPERIANMTLGQYITKLREDACETQLAVAKRARISQATLARLETDGHSRGVSLDIIKKVARAYGVSLRTLQRRAAKTPNMHFLYKRPGRRLGVKNKAHTKATPTVMNTKTTNAFSKVVKIIQDLNELPLRERREALETIVDIVDIEHA